MGVQCVETPPFHGKAAQHSIEPSVGIWRPLMMAGSSLIAALRDWPRWSREWKRRGYYGMA